MYIPHVVLFCPRVTIRQNCARHCRWKDYSNWVGNRLSFHFHSCTHHRRFFLFPQLLSLQRRGSMLIKYSFCFPPLCWGTMRLFSRRKMRNESERFWVTTKQFVKGYIKFCWSRVYHSSIWTLKSYLMFSSFRLNLKYHPGTNCRVQKLLTLFPMIVPPGFNSVFRLKKLPYFKPSPKFRLCARNYCK